MEPQRTILNAPLPEEAEEEADPKIAQDPVLVAIDPTLDRPDYHKVRRRKSATISRQANAREVTNASTSIKQTLHPQADPQAEHHFFRKKRTSRLQPLLASTSEQAAPAKNNDKPRSPTPDPNVRSRKTQSRGRSQSKDRSSGRAAACCISYALDAAPNRVQGRDGSGEGLQAHRTKTRAFGVCYLDAETCPPPNPQDLASVVSSMPSGISCPCKYMCGDDGDDDGDEIPTAILRSEHYPNLERKACNAGLEFLADTGSEEDLISKHDHATY